MYRMYIHCLQRINKKNAFHKPAAWLTRQSPFAWGAPSSSPSLHTCAFLPLRLICVNHYHHHHHYYRHCHNQIYVYGLFLFIKATSDVCRHISSISSIVIQCTVQTLMMQTNKKSFDGNGCRLQPHIHCLISPLTFLSTAVHAFAVTPVRILPCGVEVKIFPTLPSGHILIL